MSCVLPLVCCAMNVCRNLLMHVEDKFGPIFSPTRHVDTLNVIYLKWSQSKKRDTANYTSAQKEIYPLQERN